MSTQKNEHNPDNLTPEQYGAPEWRLLTKEEYGKGFEHEIRGVVERWIPSSWLPFNSGWFPFVTYRRRITPPTDTTGPVATLRGAIGVISELVRIIEKLSSTKDGKTLWECSPIKDQECYEAFLELNRIVGGAKALRTCYHLEQIPLTDTTGSRKEGETPETDAAKKWYFGDNRPGMEFECVRTEVAKKLEIERNEALAKLAAIQSRKDCHVLRAENAELAAQVEALRRAAKEFEKQVARRLWTSDDGVNIRDSDPGDYIDDDPALATAWSLFRAAIDSAQRQEGR